MSKIIILLSVFFSFLFICPQISSQVIAQVMTVTPKQLTNKNSNGINVVIGGLIPEKEYVITATRLGTALMDKVSSGEILSFHICPTDPSNSEPFAIKDNCNGKTFKEGNYNIFVLDSLPRFGHSQVLAQSSFSVNVETAGTIDYVNTSFRTTDDIVIKVSNVPDGSYKIFVDGKDPAQGGPCVDAKAGSFELNLGKYYEGTHNIQIYTNAQTLLHPLCGQGSLVTYRSFTISNAPPPPPGVPPTPVGPGPTVGSGVTSPISTVTICKSESDPTFNKETDHICTSGGGKQVIGCGDTTDTRGAAIVTAIGCIHTNPAELVKDIMTWVIGIGGGLAFLMMLFGAFQMLTSAGNPETLNAGKERLTSAVIGLLFVIFAILFLQIIGSDILQIPGFDR